MTLWSVLKEININMWTSLSNLCFQVIAQGKTKLASVPTGGAVVAGSAGSAAPAPGGDKEEKVEEKKEEKKEEEDEESDDDMGFGLFD